MTNLEKMTQMLEMQQALDKRIIGDSEYPMTKMEIALFVELGELMNEMPSYFKFWRANPIDNREKSLEEATDVLHFVMSINIASWGIDKCIELMNNAVKRPFEQTYAPLKTLIQSIASTTHFSTFFCLMHKLGFTFEELYEGYLAKNKINHERQDNNY